MDLESDKRLNIQLRLDFSSTPTGEARQAGREDIESLSTVNEPERPANTSRIMEEVCERANLKEALQQVSSNKGSAGVDRMTVDQLPRAAHSIKRHPWLCRIDARQHLWGAYGKDAGCIGAPAEQRTASPRADQRRARPLQDR